MNTTSKKLTICEGISGFKSLRNSSGYYVDKTWLLKILFDETQNAVRLITRPRRFGKSLTMSMFKEFLDIDPQNPGDTAKQQQLFAGTTIIEDREFCEKYMGKYPVISLRLSNIDASDFNKAYKQFALKLWNLANEYTYLQQSSKLNSSEKLILAKYQDPDYLTDLDNEPYLEQLLFNLSMMLYKHYGKSVVILIDEYDVPLEKAAANGYYEQFIKVLRNFFSNALKDNNDFLFKGILTGCLKITKESFFTGLNNFRDYSVLSNSIPFSDGFGFTKQEVLALLQYYGLEYHQDIVKKWYDGYRIAEKEIFCPWDVLCFCQDAISSSDPHKHQPQTYWSNTSGNGIIKSFLGYLKPEDADLMQALLDGNTVKLQFNENINYAELYQKHDSLDFWTVLLHAGYITVIATDNNDEGEILYEVRIPNLEIRKCFEKNIREFFTNDERVKHLSLNILDLMLKGNDIVLRKTLTSALKRFVSIRDFQSKSPKENFYQGFLDGYFSCIDDDTYDFKSNQETGDGYADLMFTSPDGLTGVIVELKASKSHESMPRDADKALTQIKEKNYDALFVDRTKMHKIISYGIAFYRKECAVAMKVNEYSE